MCRYLLVLVTVINNIHLRRLVGGGVVGGGDNMSELARDTTVPTDTE